MTLEMTLRALAVWAVMLLFAIANGALREAVLIPKLGSTAGLISSGVLLSIVILAVAYLSLPWLGARAPAQWAAVGLLWLALTVVLEFAFGLLRGKPLSTILEAYIFKGGDIWPVVLLVTALSPWMAAKLRGWW
jgi:hypothetical protein